MTDPDDHQEIAKIAQPRACNCLFVPRTYIKYPRPRLLRVILAYFIISPWLIWYLYHVGWLVIRFLLIFSLKGPLYVTCYVTLNVVSRKVFRKHISRLTNLQVFTDSPLNTLSRKLTKPRAKVKTNISTMDRIFWYMRRLLGTVLIYHS